MLLLFCSRSSSSSQPAPGPCECLRWSSVDHAESTQVKKRCIRWRFVVLVLCYLLSRIWFYLVPKTMPMSLNMCSICQLVCPRIYVEYDSLFVPEFMLNMSGYLSQNLCHNIENLGETMLNFYSSDHIWAAPPCMANAGDHIWAAPPCQSTKFRN